MSGALAPQPESALRISVCIATYRRPERLFLLLDDLARQSLPPAEVIVVDNDTARSAEAAAAHFAAGAAYPLRYAVQPQKNIAATRNLSVALASEAWLAFIDDDERAPRRWLRRLARAALVYHADGVLGPVVPRLPEDAPAWIRRGRFYDWTRMQSGSEIPRNRLRFGNVLLRAQWLRDGAPFDPAYGLTGGEDGDLLARLAGDGARLVWCDEAIVHEPVEAARLRLPWLLRRSLRGGQDFARHTLAGRYGPAGFPRRALLVMRAVTQLCAAALLALLLLPAGRHHAVRWLARACANFGKLSVLWGWHYREYA